MVEETIIQHGTTLVRRLVLEPGDATAWHVDCCHRVTVVIRGTALAIEYKDGGEAHRVAVVAGQADWDGPTDRVHRAVNIGRATYEEVAIFFLESPDVMAPPIAE